MPPLFRLASIDDVWPTLVDLPPLAEDALHECRAGRALCFTGVPGTFVIGLYPHDNGHALEAFVLLAVAAQRGAFEIAEPHALQVAMDLNATTVAFRSVRRGWARKLVGTAWKPRGNGEFWRWLDERQEGRHPGDAPAAGTG